MEPDRAVIIEGLETLLVAGDRVRLEQLTANLFDNIRNHTPPTTKLTITVASDSTTGTAVFADDGPGIDPATADKLFDRSARSKQSTGRSRGLFIVKRVAENHGGSVQAHSRPGIGTGTGTTIGLPLLATDQVAADNEGHRSAPPANQPRQTR